MYGLLLLVLLISSANGQGQGAIRLIVNGFTSSSSSGIVQIYYNSAWGNICDDSSFGYSEANVICHQLGYSGVSTYGNTGSTSAYGTDTSSTALEDVNCFNSNYLALLQCSVTARYSSFCNSDSNDAYVSCYTTRIWNSPYSGQLRLVARTYSNFGRLEVYCNSQWGTVCDHSFGLTDATVACRQLGYNRAYSYTGNLAGSSSQPIWLNNVPCTSSSTSCLAYCQNCPSSQFHDCVHSEDVALGCDFSSSISTPSTTTSTCTNADTISSISSSVGAIVAGVIIGSIVICVLVIAIPLCICCCLGVGIGSAARGSRRVTKTTTVTPQTTTAAIVTETVATSAPYPSTGYDNQPPPSYQPPPYPPQQPPVYPATGYAPQDPNAAVPGYPPQQAPVGYPPQNPGYPPAAGYPPQDPGYPTGYPQQPPAAYPPQI